MPSAKPLVALVLLLFATPAIAHAGLNVYAADGPVPKLQVEQPKPLQYTVAKGDTVNAIAKKFSTTTKELLAANKMADARKLKAGQVLTIPGKTMAVAPAQTKTPTPVTVAKAEPAKSGKGAKEAVDPGVAETTPVKGKRGKKGKGLTPPPPPQPSVTIDEKTRSSFGKTGVITNATEVPQAIRDEFMRYAAKWVDELDRLGVGTFTNKKIKKVGSQWEASYRVILRESLGSEVKRVQYDHTPYVGHITYVQKVYTSTAPTKAAALTGPYEEKTEAIREIFSYSGQTKAWR